MQRSSKPKYGKVFRKILFITFIIWTPLAIWILLPNGNPLLFLIVPPLQGLLVGSIIGGIVVFFLWSFTIKK